MGHRIYLLINKTVQIHVIYCQSISHLKYRRVISLQYILHRDVRLLKEGRSLLLLCYVLTKVGMLY